METIILYGVFIVASAVACIAANVNVFDDNIAYNIEWRSPTEEEAATLHKEALTVKTSHLEEYTCRLPSIELSDNTLANQSNQTSPIDLLAPLFKASTCSYRMDTYWTYEICHGQHVRQYHEDREGKMIKIQEFMLGAWNQSHFEAHMNELRQSARYTGTRIPTKKINNVDMPYFEVAMGNGTACDLNDEKRNVSLLYVCVPYGKHEIYTLKEVFTCQYEVIILAPELCSHPLYRSAATNRHSIYCEAVKDTGTKKPYNLLKMERDTLIMMRKSDGGRS